MEPKEVFMEPSPHLAIPGVCGLGVDGGGRVDIVQQPNTCVSRGRRRISQVVFMMVCKKISRLAHIAPQRMLFNNLSNKQIALHSCKHVQKVKSMNAV